MDRIVIQDQAEWDNWKGVLILTDNRLRFERPGIPPGNFIVCFDLDVTKIGATVEGFPRKLFIRNSEGPDMYKINVKNPNEWMKMLLVLRGR